MSYKSRELSTLEQNHKWQKLLLEYIDDFRKIKSKLITSDGYDNITIDISEDIRFILTSKDLLEMLHDHYLKSIKGAYKILEGKDIDPTYLEELTKV